MKCMVREFDVWDCEYNTEFPDFEIQFDRIADARAYIKDNFHPTGNVFELVTTKYTEIYQ